MRHWLLVLFWLGTALGGRAQAWQRDPVLSALRLNKLEPDSAGFMWAATDRSVYRYDGYQAVPLNDLIREGLRLPSGTVKTLVFAGGHLWIGTESGLYAYAAGQLLAVPLPPNAGGQSVEVLCLHPQTGRLWVSYGTAASVVAVLNPRWPTEGLVAPVARGKGAVFGLLDAPAGGIWAVRSEVQETWLLDARCRVRRRLKGHFNWARQGTSGPAYQFSTTPDLVVPGSGGRWLADRNALYEVGPDGYRRVAQRWAQSNISRGIMQLDSTWYWWRNGGFTQAPELHDGRHHTLVKLTWRAGRPPKLTLSPLPPLAFAGEYRLQVGAAGSGLLWAFAAGQQQGCYKRRIDRARIQTLPVVGGKLLSTRALTRLPDGQLLVGSYAGSFVQAPDSPTAPLRPLKEVTDVVRAALTTRRGDVVLATETGSLPAFRTLDPRTLASVPYHGRSAQSATDLTACCLLEDQRGQVWGGTSSGLVLLDPQRRELVRYHDADTTFALHTRRVEALIEAPAGVLWVGTNDGLYRLHVATGRLTRYGPDEGGARRVPTVSIQCLWAPHPDSLWVGTIDQGLLLVNPRRGVMRQVSTSQGLPNEAVASILPAPQPGILWIGTYAGLVRYQTRTGQLTVLGEADGLAANELNKGSAYRDPRTGLLYFGGVGGVSKLDPRQRFANPSRPRLLMTRIAQHDAARDSVFFDWLPERFLRKGLQLAPRDLFVELEFALADYDVPKLARFSSRLVGGGERQFRPLGPTNELHLQNLPAGNYTIEVRGETGRGVAAANVLRIPLVVKDVWWRQPWVGGVALCLLGAAFYLRQRQRDARRAHDQQLRASIAADLHDEVGALLTGVTMQAELLQALEAPTSVRLNDLITDSRAASAVVRDIIWSIDTGVDTLEALSDRIRDYLGQISRGTGWTFSFAGPAVFTPGALRPAVRQHVYLIFKEAVTNAIKHSHHGSHLHVVLNETSTELRLSITDNGTPSPVPRGRAGQGTRNMEKRATLLAGTLAAGYEPATGWVVHLRVPQPYAQ